MIIKHYATDRIGNCCQSDSASMRGCTTQQTVAVFFLVGAGISHPPIPLASEIEASCKVFAQKYGRTDEPIGNQPIDKYSHWFQRAYPQPIQRQAILRSLINGKPISHANLRLAHLLSERSIANIVVTPNFDDFLFKALALFGIQPIVCDHPRTVDRIDPEQRDLQIVHVHGSYWFYDCCNLRAEIQERAESLAFTVTTMGALLDRILSRRSPLVIGYGGWEGDVIMAALKRRLQGPLAYNLYWFCYQRANLEILPDWLKNNRDVYFVVPQEESVREVVATQFREESRAKDWAEDILPSGTDRVTDKEKTRLTLPAQQVLDKLIQSFNVKAPELTNNPLRFFAKNLRQSLPPEDFSATQGDIYFIRSVIERIERAEQKEKETKQEVESKMEVIRNALRRSQYVDALRQGGEINKTDLDTRQLQELMHAMWSASIGLEERLEEKLDALDLVIVLGDLLLQKGITDAALSVQVAKALRFKSYALGELHRDDESIAVCDELVKRFGGMTESALLEEVGETLYLKGLTLTVLNRHEEAIVAYDEIIKLIGDNGPTFQGRHADVLVLKGEGLSQLGRSEEAIVTYDEVVKRFGDSAEPDLREQVARALISKGNTHDTVGRSEEAIATYDEVVKRFGDSAELDMREQVALALGAKGPKLVILDRSEEAIATYGDVVKRFGDSTELVLQQWVAWAIFMKGTTLKDKLGHSEEALVAYDELLKRFSGAADPYFRIREAWSLINKGGLLNKLSRVKEAIAAYDEVVRRFGDSTENDFQKLVESAQAAKRKLRRSRRS